MASLVSASCCGSFNINITELTCFPNCACCGDDVAVDKAASAQPSPQRAARSSGACGAWFRRTFCCFSSCCLDAEAPAKEVASRLFEDIRGYNLRRKETLIKKNDEHSYSIVSFRTNLDLDVLPTQLSELQEMGMDREFKLYFDCHAAVSNLFKKAIEAASLLKRGALRSLNDYDHLQGAVQGRIEELFFLGERRELMQIYPGDQMIQIFGRALQADPKKALTVAEYGGLLEVVIRTKLAAGVLASHGGGVARGPDDNGMASSTAFADVVGGDEGKPDPFRWSSLSVYGITETHSDSTT